MPKPSPAVSPAPTNETEPRSLGGVPMPIQASRLEEFEKAAKEQEMARGLRAGPAWGLNPQFLLRGPDRVQGQGMAPDDPRRAGMVGGDCALLKRDQVLVVERVRA